MMKRLNTLDWLALGLVVVGAINWGLVGFFAYNLVAVIFGVATFVTRAIYAIIGLAGLYSLYTMSKLTSGEAVREETRRAARAA